MAVQKDGGWIVLEVCKGLVYLCSGGVNVLE